MGLYGLWDHTLLHSWEDVQSLEICMIPGRMGGPWENVCSKGRCMVSHVVQSEFMESGASLCMQVMFQFMHVSLERAHRVWSELM